MPGGDLEFRIGATPVAMRLNDFNKLRWTVQALIWQPRLLDHARAHALAEVRVIDSQIAMSSPQAPLPSGCVVVLWDGLNAWLELKNARPELAARTDVTYLYVGGLIDIQAGFPESSAPLFPSQLPDVRRSPDHHLPLRFRATGWMRRSLRPLKNARLDPAAHDRLVKGGCVAFCGIVRPNASMLDGFFFESSLPDLGQAAKSLIGLEWRDRPAAMHAALHPVYEILRRQRPRSASDFAAMYSLLNVMHRLATLSLIDGTTANLLVNEYGVQAHLDPYDTRGYVNNLFVDFGSTRGPDLVYPRAVDLWTNGKRSVSLRLLEPGRSLSEYLAANDAQAFWAGCEMHAKAVMSAATASPAAEAR